VEKWTTVDNLFMSKRDANGRERFAASQIASRVDVRFEMAYKATMDPDLVDVPKAFRLVYQGRIFDITSACHLGLQDGIELLTVASTRIDL
jgi:SPP1 family predicted phage head-tail adaptor